MMASSSAVTVWSGAKQAPLSSTRGSADAAGARHRLEPAHRALYARALEDFFDWWNEQGRPAFTRATVQAWRTAQAKGILCAVARRGGRPHDLRRTFAKLAYKGGAKLDEIQLSLGHASIQTTERYLGVQQDLTLLCSEELAPSLHRRLGRRIP
jgi:integrase